MQRNGNHYWLPFLLKCEMLYYIRIMKQFYRITYFLLFTSVLFLTSCEEENTNIDLPPVKNPVSTDTMEKIIELKTNFGTMYMWLQKETPLHRANFLALADSQFFDQTTFHRCVPNFVIQGGDVNSKDADTTNDGSGSLGYTIPAEIDITKLKHKRGAVGAARTNNPAKASNSSQFYIVLPAAGTPSLDGNYTVFGQIIQGMEVADSIVKQPQKTSNNRPFTDIKMDVNVINKSRKELREGFGFEAN